MNDWRELPMARRTLFLSVNLAACLMVWFCVVMPIYEIFAERDARITEERAPAALASLELSRQAERIAAAAPARS